MHLPAFTAPTRHTDPADALAQVQRIYQQQIGHLRGAMQRFVAGETPEGPVRAFYPFVRVHTTTVARADTKLAYGFVEGPGRYETTLTRPDLFANYYAEQFRLLRAIKGLDCWRYGVDDPRVGSLTAKELVTLGKVVEVRR